MGIPRSRDLPVIRASRDGSVADTYERILDKGIVIDGWMRVSLAGLDLVHINLRVVAASINTYLAKADALAMTGVVSPPLLCDPQPIRKPRQVRRKLPRAGKGVG